MKLIISRLSTLPEGFEVAVQDENVNTIAVINGNKPNFSGPILLLELDPHIVYGLSHPSVISRILAERPQELYTSKELAHRLFEHGMKASWGTVKVRNSQFLTTLSTFYTVKTEGPKFKFLGDKSRPAIGIQIPNRKDVVITASDYYKDTNADHMINVNNIKTVAMFSI